jgi:hypothetical protein
VSSHDEWLAWRRDRLIYGHGHGSVGAATLDAIRRHQLRATYYDGAATAQRYYLNKPTPATTGAPMPGYIDTDRDTAPDPLENLDPDQMARASAVAIAASVQTGVMGRNPNDVLDIAEYIVNGDRIVRSKRKDKPIITRHRAEDEGDSVVWNILDVEATLTETVPV